MQTFYFFVISLGAILNDPGTAGRTHPGTDRRRFGAKAGILSGICAAPSSFCHPSCAGCRQPQRDSL